MPLKCGTGLSLHVLPSTCDHFAIHPLGSCGIEGCRGPLWGVVEVTDFCFSSVFSSKGVQPLFGSKCRLARRLSRHKQNTTVSAMAALARTVASPSQRCVNQWQTLTLISPLLAPWPCCTGRRVARVAVPVGEVVFQEQIDHS